LTKLRSLIFYFILLILALVFLFPLLWMVVTSFKVPGTGDKFLYVPEQKVAFRFATEKEFEKADIPLNSAQMAKLETLRTQLYSGSKIPLENELFSALEEVTERRLSQDEKRVLLQVLSVRFDINSVDIPQLKKILGASHEEAEAIFAYRLTKGDFDSPTDLEAIPLFSEVQFSYFLSFFSKDTACIHRLDQRPYRRSLELTGEREEVYVQYRDNNGFSVHDPDEIQRIPRFSREKVERWKQKFYSNRLYTLSNYQKILSASPRGDSFTLSRAFVNSTLVSVGTALVTLFVCLLAGYVFAKKDFTGKKLIYSALWASMLIPGMMFLVPQYAIVTWLDGINTYWAMIVPHCANIFGLYLVKQYIEQIPHSLFEAATMDGASELQIFRILIIPLTLPILTTLFLLTFLGQWSNFLWQLITNTPDSMRMTLPVTLAYFKGQYASDWTALMAGATFMLIPIVFLFLIAQRTLIRGMTEGAVKE
jgi:ABC-type glycerol-3-phosphate transport system permease component